MRDFTGVGKDKVVILLNIPEEELFVLDKAVFTKDDIYDIINQLKSKTLKFKPLSK